MPVLRSKETVIVHAIQVLIAASIFLLWEYAAPLGLADRDILPPLSSVLAKLWELLHDPEFRENIQVTALETAVSFIIMVPVGLLLGLVIGERPHLYRLVRGPLDLLMATPKALFLPLFIFAFGIGYTQKVLFALSLGIFVVILNGIAAVHSIPQGLTRAARSMGATKQQIYFYIYLPGMMPLIIGSMRMGFIYTVLGILLAEMYVSRRGLGRFMLEAGDSYQLASMLAAVLLVMTFSITVSEILRQAEGMILKRRKDSE